MPELGRKLIRLFIVVGPIIAAGFYLGVSGVGHNQPAEPHGTLEFRTTPTHGEVKKNIAPSMTEKPWAQRLSGFHGADEMSSTTFETTTLSLAEAWKTYDAQADAAGWIFQPNASAQINQDAGDDSAHIYFKEGSMRVVVIGPPEKDGITRAVSIYTGRLASR